MTEPKRPAPTDPDQHAPGVSKTLEENATRFRTTSAEERMEPKLKPIVPPLERDRPGADADREKR